LSASISYLQPLSKNSWSCCRQKARAGDAKICSSRPHTDKHAHAHAHTLSPHAHAYPIRFFTERRQVHCLMHAPCMHACISVLECPPYNVDVRNLQALELRDLCLSLSLPDRLRGNMPAPTPEQRALPRCPQPSSLSQDLALEHLAHATVVTLCHRDLERWGHLGAGEQSPHTRYAHIYEF